MAEAFAGVLPYLIGFSLLIGFLATVMVGLGLAMSLIYLQAMTSTLKKFNLQMDQAQAAFAQQIVTVEKQNQERARMSEAWTRQRKEQFEDVDTAKTGAGAPFNRSYTQDWRAQ